MSIYDHIQQLDEIEMHRQEYILDNKDEILELVKEEGFYFPERVTRFLLDNYIEEIEILQDVDVNESGQAVYKFIGFNFDKVINKLFFYDCDLAHDLDNDDWLDLYMSVWHTANQQKNQRLIAFLEKRIKNKYA